MAFINELKSKESSTCIVGLGYVGLPLATLFSQKYKVIAYDINSTRIDELKHSYDRTGEIKANILKDSKIEFTNNPGKIKESRLIIITVPTPIDSHNTPDLNPILTASKSVGQNIKAGSIVVYESTVYPGLIEEICVPILEQESGLKWKKGFNVGYSPERVNPGDRNYTIEKITKVVAGDTKKTTNILAFIYGSIIPAGIYKTSSIKVAEAAKVIENTQRDLNIALMNELSIIFNKLNIYTKEVLEAANTKWNFLSFEPGLVGGHCIGVDPYYLTYKSEQIGYHPQVILSGRRINDAIGKFIVANTIKSLIKANKTIKNNNVLIMGITFKENIKDIRNTKIIDIYSELIDYGINISIHDPYADHVEVNNEYNIKLVKQIDKNAPYQGIILAVKHKFYLDNYNLKKLKKLCVKEQPVLIDIKNIYERLKAEQLGFIYWSL